MSQSNFWRVAGVVLTLALGPVSGRAQPIDAGRIDATIDVRAMPVRVAAENAELQALASKAFAVHGAFAVSGSAATVIRFAATGATSVRVTVERKGGAGFAQDVAGSSLRHALLRAADAAVTHLTGKPGFFAGRVAFVSESTGSPEVYVADLFFGEVRRMTSDRAQVVSPRWAPDGRRILYTGYFRGGVPDVYQIDTSTNQRTAFISVKGTNTGARFSPNGSQVAVILSSAGSPDVWVGNAQGKQLRALAKTPNQIEATPSWAPEGNRLVVASDALATGKPQLYIIGLSGAMQRLATNISGYCAEPDWSHANRDLIAFTFASGSSYQVGVFSLSGQSTRAVTSVSGDALEPSWTSDGRHLLYTHRTGTSQRIWIIDTVSKRATVLSPTSLGRSYAANFVLR